MEDTYQKVVDENGNVISQVVRQVVEPVDLDLLNARIASTQDMLNGLKALRDSFSEIPDPTE